VGIKGKPYRFTAGTPKADILEPDIFQMISKAYEPIGGHVRITSRANVGNEYPEWGVADIDEDPEPDVVIVGKHSDAGGMKIGATATDGTLLAKSFMNIYKKELLTNGGWWGEVSGAPAHIAINNLGIAYVNDKAHAERLLNQKVKWHGSHPDGKFRGVEGWYSRNINGHEYIKIIVGDFPN